MSTRSSPRAPKDIDIIARKEDAERIREVARATGFVFEAVPMVFSSTGIEVHRFTKLVEGRPLVLDVLWLHPTLRAVWDDRQRVQWRSCRVTA